jgi:hypothetical protein
MNGAPAVIGAGDHMITAGDVEFEQPQPKMWKQGAHAVAMLYGDSAAQTTIALHSEAAVLHGRVSEVGEIARIYQSNLQKYVRELAEAAVLSPLDLTINSFLASANTLGPDLASALTRRVQDYYYERGLSQYFGGAIIAGADTHGGHIFKVEYGHCTRLDRIGFVAAGAGQWHAESQFMFSRYIPEWEHQDALSLVYSAKKRAEVAPGVGQETDIVIIFTNPPNVLHFAYNSPLVKSLEGIYQDTQKKHDDATASQHKAVRKWFDDLPKQIPTPPASPTPATAAPTPAPTVNPTQSTSETSEPEQ